MLYEAIENLSVLEEDEISEIFNDEELPCYMNGDSGVIDLDAHPDMFKVKKEILEIAKASGLYVVNLRQKIVKGKGIVSTLFTYDDKFPVFFVCRRPLAEEIEIVTPYDPDDTFSERVVPLGIIDVNELTDALIKARANKELIKDVKEYLEQDANGEFFVDSSPDARRFIAQVLDAVDCHLVSETTEESTSCMTEAYCYFNGMRFVNVSRHYFTRSPLKESFCEYPRI